MVGFILEYGGASTLNLVVFNLFGYGEIQPRTWWGSYGGASSLIGNFNLNLVVFNLVGRGRVQPQIWWGSSSFQCLPNRRIAYRSYKRNAGELKLSQKHNLPSLEVQITLLGSGPERDDVL